MRSLTRRDFVRTGGLVTAGGVLALSGCGQDQAAKMRVEIANTRSTNTLALQKLLEEQGYLEEFRVTASMRNLTDGAKVLTTVLGDRADLTMFSGMGEILAAIEKGNAVRIIGGAAVRPQLAIYSAKAHITRVEDLLGRTVGTGTPGAQLAQAVTAVLRKRGIDPKRVRFVNVGSSTDVLRAVVAGKVDAGPSLVDVYDNQAKLGIHTIADVWAEVPRFLYQVIYASDRALSTKRDAVVRTLAAHAKLYRFIQSPESRDAYLAAYTSVAKGKDAEAESIWRFVQRHRPYALDLDVDSDSLTYMQDLAISVGSLRSRLPESRVLDRSLAAEAIRMIDSPS